MSMSFAPWKTRRRRFLGLVVALVWNAGVSLRSAAVEVSALPPAASAPVDFARDIQPLLERSCLRCHGPERPKSGFRLDSREAALRGGSQGVDIVVSNSAASPLIHNVARLKDVEEDSWMPPEGKAPALSSEEVALFRAWVDQGLPWSTNAPPPAFSLDANLTLGGTAVSENQAVFREQKWQPDGWNGGVESFQLGQQVDDRTLVTAEGRALRDDYRVVLQANRRELGFVRAGFEQYRKYYSDSGGYFAEFTPPLSTLGRDLHLDLGRSWVDFGLARPNWPRLTVGYEHLYKDGEKSLTSWSPITQNGTTANIFPTSKEIEEEAHALKFKLDHEVWGLRLEDDFRAEWAELRTTRTNTVLNPPESDALYLDRVREKQDSFQAANAFRMERQFTRWLLASGGYLYSHFDAEGSFNLDESYVSGTPGFARRWTSPGITIESDSHVGNLNGQFGPWDGFTAAVGVQSAWTRQQGLGDASFDFEQAGGGYFLQPATQESALDRVTVTEHVGLRYAKVPRTVFFAEGRLQQETLDHFEEQLGGETPLRRGTDASSGLLDFRGGFNTSPWRPLSISGSYRWLEKQTSYDHWMDLIPTPFGDFPSESYSAFIRDRETDTQEVEVRLAYHWSARLKTSFSYRLVASDYWTATDPLTGYDPVTFEPIPGGITPGTRLLAGNYDAHVFSFNAVCRPLQRLTLNTTFSVHDARTASADNGAASVADYQGQTYSFLLGGTYFWNAKTDLHLNYAFSHADYDQDELTEGLRLGVVYRQHGLMAGLRRRISDRASAALRYGFFLYDEPSSGGYNDYTAHQVFATLAYRVP